MEANNLCKCGAATYLSTAMSGTILMCGNPGCSFVPVALTEDEELARWMAGTAKTCRNGCGGCAGYRPCPGCMAGGMCDEFECVCDDVHWEQGDPEERDYDPDEDRTP